MNKYSRYLDELEDLGDTGDGCTCHTGHPPCSYCFRHGNQEYMIEEMINSLIDSLKRI